MGKQNRPAPAVMFVEFVEKMCMYAPAYGYIYMKEYASDQSRILVAGLL